MLLINIMSFEKMGGHAPPVEKSEKLKGLREKTHSQEQLPVLTEAEYSEFMRSNLESGQSGEGLLISDEERKAYEKLRLSKGPRK